MLRVSERGLVVARATMSIGVLGDDQHAEALLSLFLASGVVPIEAADLDGQEARFTAVAHCFGRQTLEIRPTPATTTLVAEDQSESELMAASVQLQERCRYGEFQPVWMIYPQMQPLGVELLAIDDDDASSQLDVLYDALTAERARAGSPLQAMKRSHMTIKPRWGWQRYGPERCRVRS